MNTKKRNEMANLRNKVHGLGRIAAVIMALSLACSQPLSAMTVYASETPAAEQPAEPEVSASAQETAAEPAAEQKAEEQTPAGSESITGQDAGVTAASEGKVGGWIDPADTEESAEGKNDSAAEEGAVEDNDQKEPEEPAPESGDGQKTDEDDGNAADPGSSAPADENGNTDGTETPGSVQDPENEEVKTDAEDSENKEENGENSEENQNEENQNAENEGVENKEENEGEENKEEEQPEENPYADLMPLAQLSALPDTVADATTIYYGKNAAPVNERGWAANIYYVNQAPGNEHHVDKSENFNLKYQLEFTSSLDLPAYAVEVRVPASLVNYVGEDVITPVLPAAVGVPQGLPGSDVPGHKTFFNYYYGYDEYGQQQLVFYNYTDIPANSLSAWQVLYSGIDISQTGTDTEWSVAPVFRVQTEGGLSMLNDKELRPLSGRIVQPEENGAEEREAGEGGSREPELITTEENREAENLTVEELKEVPADEAEATFETIAEEEETDTEAREKELEAAENDSDDHSEFWWFDTYYVSPEYGHYVERSDNFSLKYQMEFHNNQDIEKNRVEVRIPISLVKYGHGNETRQDVLPSDIGVPQGTPAKPRVARKSYFNYYIDEGTGELVFFNYRKIPAATNNAWQVLFPYYDVMQIEDTFAWTVKPSVKVTLNRPVLDEEGVQLTDEQGNPATELVTQELTEEERTACALSGKVDTRIQLQTTTKQVYSSNASYTPGLYTLTQLKRFYPNAEDVVIPAGTDEEGENLYPYAGEKLVDHFNDYVYVVWKITAGGYATQPYNLVLKETTGYSNNGDVPGGFILGATEISRYNNYIQDISISPDGEKPAYAGVGNAVSYSKDRSLEKYYFVVTAYPRNEVRANETIVKNTVTAVMEPYDADYIENGDEDQEMTGSAKWTYVDYRWTYSGDIIGVRKDGNPDEHYTWVTAYKLLNGLDVPEPKDRDLKTSDFRVYGTCRSFALTHYLTAAGDHSMGQYIPSTYAKVTTTDDVVYAYAKDGPNAGNKYLLTKEDYYFNKVTAAITTSGYDVYEDQTAGCIPESETPGIDRKLYVYAMYALNADGTKKAEDEWELAGTVDWDSSGSLSYSFTADQIAREPWRVRMEQNSVDYATYSTISTNISIKGDSPTFRNNFTGENNDTSTILVENIGGIMGEYFVNGEFQRYFQDTRIENGNYSEAGLAELTQALYGTILMRDSKLITLYSEEMHAAAKKSGKAYNDPEHSRANVRYAMEAFEGYLLYDREAIDFLKEAGAQTPHRSEMVFYDLLPFGVQFDPSGTVTAGRMKSIYHFSEPAYAISESSWDKNQVSVAVDPEKDVIQNYHDTGRTMVVFHITYTGRDSSIFEGSSKEWFTGFGVAFDAYCDYEDYTVATERPNIVAYMPEAYDTSKLLGRDTEVSCDNGNVASTDGFTEYYQELGSDINGDKITDIRNVLYASSQVFSDIAIATYGTLEKEVRADTDPYGTYRQSTSVQPGEGYEYRITVSNSAGGSMKDLVIFDHLENAAVDRAVIEAGSFDRTYWRGAFDGVITAELEAMGARPVVYYNESREAAFPEEDQDPFEILQDSSTGWVEADSWENDIADVKSIAVVAHSPEAEEEFKIEAGGSVSVRVRMKAPEAVPEEGTIWAYNNAAFYAFYEKTNNGQTTIGNSIRVKLVDTRILEVEKAFADGVPEARENDEFRFFLTWPEGKYVEEDYEEEYSFSQRAYTLYQKDEDGNWIRQAGMYATDADGALYLKEGQKAVFQDLDAENVQIREEEKFRWTYETEEESAGTTRAVKVINTYHPLLYVQKQLTGYPADMKDEYNLKSFTLQLTKKNESGVYEPVAEKEFYLVNRAVTNGGEPTVIDAEHKLYGNLSVPEEIPEGIRTMVTDENGYFEIYPNEILAFRVDHAGEEYKVVESADEYSIETDWMCDDPDFEAAVPANGILGTIRNQYRMKDVLISKTVSGAGSNDVSSQEFTFKIYAADGQEKGAQIRDFVWQLLDSESSEADEEAWLQPGSDGEITAACAGKVIRVHQFKVDQELIVEEVLDEEVSALYEAEDDDIYVKIPKYASVGRAAFTNMYRMRDLNITKTVTKAGDEDLSGQEFTFKIYAAAGQGSKEKGRQITDFTWQLLEDANAEVDEDGWLQPGNNGEITAACAGKVIRVHQFTFDQELIIEEVLDEDTAEFYKNTGGDVYVKIPRNTAAGTAAFTNEWMYRDLKVEKNIITADNSADLSDVTFTMYLYTAPEGVDPADETRYVPAAGKTYAVYYPAESVDEEDWLIREGTTGEDGSFTINARSYALFRNVDREGRRWLVKELADDTYKPVVPGLAEVESEEGTGEDSGRSGEDGTSGEGGTSGKDEEEPGDPQYTEPVTGVIGTDETATFLNGDSGMLIIRKKWIADDSTSQRYLDYYGGPNDSYVDLDFSAPMQQINGTGRNSSVYVKWDEWNELYSAYQVYFNRYGVNDGGAYAVLKLHDEVDSEEYSDLFDFNEVEYTVTEQNPQYAFSGGYYNQYGNYNQYDRNGMFDGVTFMVNPDNEEIMVKGVAGEQPEIVIENHLASYTSVIQKRVYGKAVPAGSTLVWRLERYTNGEWVPAEGVGYEVDSVTAGYFYAESNGQSGQIRTLLQMGYYNGALDDFVDWDAVEAGEFNPYWLNDIIGNYGMPATPVPKFNGKTGSDGLIRMTTERSFHPIHTACMPMLPDSPVYNYWVECASEMTVRFNEKVYVNDTKDFKEGELRVVEVPELTDAAWGTQLAYTTSSPSMVPYLKGNTNYSYYPYYSSLLDLNYTCATGAGKYTATGFVNSTGMQKLRVEKVVDEPADQVFTFTLEQFNDPFRGSELTPGAGLNYTVYNTATKEKVRTGVTTADGKFTLQGGQYALIEVEPYTKWRVTEDESLPYYVKSRTLNGKDQGSGDSTDVALLEERMIRGDFETGMWYLANAVMPNQSIYGPKNIIFGKKADYPDVTSRPSIPMDTNFEGTIEGYVVPNGDGTFDFYVLSDGLMYTNYSCGNMMSYLYTLQSVKFDNVDTGKTRNMACMFTADYNLQSVTGMENWDTGNVTTMASMFLGTGISDVSGLQDWDTGKVRDMQHMFQSCIKLTDLSPLAAWNTGSVTNMTSMFQNTGLTNVNGLQDWDTSQVRYIDSMFYGCPISNINALSGWDTSNVVSAEYTFAYCSNLSDLTGLSGWNVSGMRNAYGMFYADDSLTSLGALSSWRPTSLYEANYMFCDCDGLTTLAGLENWNPTNLYNAYQMFYDCDGLTSADALKSWPMNNLNNANYMFAYCDQLTTADLSGWNSDVHYNYMQYMFQGCPKLVSVNLQNMSHIYETWYMFDNCSSLESVDLSGLKTLEYAQYVFRNCSELKSIALSSLTQISSSGDHMFYNCGSLESVDLGSVTNINNANYMFQNCTGLKDVDLGSVTNIYNANYMFQNCTGLKDVDLGSATYLTYASYMFDGCSSLESVDLGSVTNINNANYMFQNCTGLKDVDLGSAIYLTYASNMFDGCSSLESIDLSKVTTINDASYMFRNCISLKTCDISKMSRPSSRGYSMFHNDGSLTTIYCDNNWNSYYNSYYYTNMFYGCEALPNFNAAYTGITMANSSNSGYFTKKS